MHQTFPDSNTPPHLLSVALPLPQVLCVRLSRPSIEDMDLYILFHSVVMHVTALMVVLVYIPLSVPVKLFMWALVKPFRKEDLRGNWEGRAHHRRLLRHRRGTGLPVRAERGMPSAGGAEEEGAGMRRRGRSRTRRAGCPCHPSRRLRRRGVEARRRGNSRAFRQIEPSGRQCRGLGHRLLRRSHQHNCIRQDDGCEFLGFRLSNPLCAATPQGQQGKTHQSCSGAGTVATPRMSFYNATKAAQLRFYETLRSEFGTEVGITILTPGYVESEITQGKAIQKDGVLAVNEETRDAQVGVFPVGRVETFCEIALDSIQKGDWYLTWPSLYRPMELIACIAPEVLNWICYQLYNTRNGGRSLALRIAEATGVRQLYPSTLQSPGIKTE